MVFNEVFNGILGILTFVADIVILIALLGYFLLLTMKKKKLTGAIKSFFHKNGFLIVFIIALIGTLGSLTYSEILGLNPCKLCWYQRIMMYPITVVSLVGLIRKSKEYFLAIIPMSIIGVLFAAYHYSVQFLPTFVQCSLEGAECATKLVFGFGYITIPMMALTAFLAIAVISIFSYRK